MLALWCTSNAPSAADVVAALVALQQLLQVDRLADELIALVAELFLFVYFEKRLEQT